MNNRYKKVGKGFDKLDSLSLATGWTKYVDDLKLDNPVYIKVLYSPEAHAMIKKIDTTKALELEGVLGVFHHENVKRVLHTTAGQGFPEPSPYDTALFNDRVRFVGDRVAMVVAEAENIAEEALRLIDVEYEPLPYNFDMMKAMDNAPLLHEDDEFMPIPVPYDATKNMAAALDMEIGKPDDAIEKSEFKLDHTFSTAQTSHCAIEPHAAIGHYDERGRMVIHSTTQVPFHARRMVARILDIPIRDIRIFKPRIGGGFGGKQEVILEPLVALALREFRRPVRLLFTRPEVFVSGRTRNPMTIRLRTGFDKDGTLNAIDMHATLGTGAYGSHALTVLSNAGAKVLPLLNKVPNIRFTGRSVYTNTPVGGAYRGYGATKGYFALNQHIDMIARQVGVCPLEWIKKWHIKEGETSEVFSILGEGKEGVAQLVNSCGLSEAIDLGSEWVNWKELRGKKIRNGDLVKGLGFCVSMQGSGIPHIDMASAYIKMNEDGSFNLHIGATDIGTGSDTILAQIAAEVLDIDPDRFIVKSSDTDNTPFDVGAYASSTTYVSGGAVLKCAEKIADQVLQFGAEMLEIPREQAEIQEGRVIDMKSDNSVSFEKIGYYSMYTHNLQQIQATASHVGQESPPPFAAAFADVDVDVKTGHVYVRRFVTAVDCGQPINPVLVEGQIEGAALNGITYALTENYDLDSKGRMKNQTFWYYKIYSTMDMPDLKSIVVPTHEKTGPFGAKSVGEIGINGPIPAIANAIFDAVGVRIFDTPFTPEKVLRRIQEEG